MKKNFLIIFLVIFSSTLLAQKGLDLSVRYLKLSNTYREAGDFNKSEEYLNKAKKLLNAGSNWDYKYWNAVSYEYSGLLNKDRFESAEDKEKKDFYKRKAYQELKRALDEYKRIIDINDGSQVPAKELLASLSSLNQVITSIDYKSDSRVFNFEKLKLRNLPRGIPKNATNVTMSENKFQEIPSGLSSYTELVYLNMSYNKIRKVGNSITELKNLKWLDLSNNKIRDLEIEFCKMQSLKELDLSNNKLKSLPACLCDLQNLKILNLKGNKLPYPEIAKLIKCLPNTNIFIDTYILEKEKKI